MMQRSQSRGSVVQCVLCGCASTFSNDKLSSSHNNSSHGRPTCKHNILKQVGTVPSYFLSHDQTLSANQRSLNVRYISCNHALVS